MSHDNSIFELEYRLVVLNGIIDWMMANAVFIKAIEASEVEQIHRKARKAVEGRIKDSQRANSL